jgi:hypothetical protein
MQRTGFRLLWTKRLVHVPNHLLLFNGPVSLLDVGPQVVLPTLTALLPRPICVKSIVHFLSDIRPVWFAPSALIFYQIREELVFLRGDDKAIAKERLSEESSLSSRYIERTMILTSLDQGCLCFLLGMLMVVALRSTTIGDLDKPNKGTRT